MKTMIKVFALGVALAAIICCFLFTSICTVQYKSEELSKISVFDNLTFTEFEITDPSAMQDLVLQINGFSPAFGIRTVPTGSHYTIHLYDLYGSIVDSITIVDSSHVVHRNCVYWTHCQTTIDYLSAFASQKSQ